MKKILFVLDFIYSGHTTNIRLAQAVATQLKARYDVWFLCNADKNPMPTEKVILFKSYADKTSYDTVNKVRREGGGAFGIAIELAKKPKALLNVATTVLLKYSLAEKVFKKEIERACKQQDFYAVISVSCPHYSMFATASSDIKAKKIAYIMDPYGGNATMQYAVSRKKEMDFFKKIDSAVITEQMYDYYSKNKLKQYINKMTIAQFPALVRKESIGLDSNKIICAFVGNLYPAIRDPGYLFTLAGRLDENISFNFTGGGYEGFKAGYLESFVKKLDGRLSLNPAVDSKEADRILSSADVLINIGNSVENQLPSKVIEYMGFAKPILNIYKTDVCPSLGYYKRHPLAFNVKEGDLSDSMINQVNNFLLQARGKTIPYEVIEKMFVEATPTYVAKQFDRILLEI